MYILFQNCIFCLLSPFSTHFPAPSYILFCFPHSPLPVIHIHPYLSLTRLPMRHGSFSPKIMVLHGPISSHLTLISFIRSTPSSYLTQHLFIDRCWCLFSQNHGGACHSPRYARLFPSTQRRLLWGQCHSMG